MATVVVTPNTGTVITAADVRAHCRIDTEDEDGLISAMHIPAAVAAFEQRTRCKLLTTTLRQLEPAWPVSGRLDLAWGVVTQVVDVRYVAPSGAELILPSAAYELQQEADGVHTLYLISGAALPDLADRPGAVRINYRAGWADANSVPGNVKTWLLAYAAYLWAHRGDDDKSPPPPQHLDVFIAGLLRPSI